MPDLTRQDAARLKSKLMNAPVAPGGLSPVINVGTERLLDVLEEQYFKHDLADGISCFKYLEGDYGSGKSQFIQCLADRAHHHGIVTSLVTIGQECPFSSPLSIYRNVVSSFVPASREAGTEDQKGIEILIQGWIKSELRKHGVTPGNAVPDEVRNQIARPFDEPYLGASDMQAGAALKALGKRLLAMEAGADLSSADNELISWIRGDNIRSAGLKQTHGLYEPATDATAFQRLKTLVHFLRSRLNYQGFLIAFDEGTRTMSFRRGTVKQRQAIENMLTMINQNAEGEFGGVMFLYAATPELRTDVIQNTYIALNDRIGSVAFIPGQPMTPLIKLDDINTDATLVGIGQRLLEVFSVADRRDWNEAMQLENMKALINAEKRLLGFPTTVPPRFFVYHWCLLLESQRAAERVVDLAAAGQFVESNRLPDSEA